MIVDPELARLLAACAVGNWSGADDLVRKLRDRFDTPIERGRLARSLVRLRDEGLLGDSLAAVAFLDLSRDDCPALIEAALRHVATVKAGVARSSSGLLVV